MEILHPWVCQTPNYQKKAKRRRYAKPAATGTYAYESAPVSGAEAEGEEAMIDVTGTVTVLAVGVLALLIVKAAKER